MLCPLTIGILAVVYFFASTGNFPCKYNNQLKLVLQMHKKINVTRHAKRNEFGGRRHFEKICVKVNVASRKNSTAMRVSKRSLTYYKTGSKAFFHVEVFCHQTVKHFVRY